MFRIVGCVSRVQGISRISVLHAYIRLRKFVKVRGHFRAALYHCDIDGGLGNSTQGFSGLGFMNPDQCRVQSVWYPTKNSQHGCLFVQLESRHRSRVQASPSRSHALPAGRGTGAGADAQMRIDAGYPDMPLLRSHTPSARAPPTKHAHMTQAQCPSLVQHIMFGMLGWWHALPLEAPSGRCSG